MTSKRLKRPTDPIQLGKLIGDILTGQVQDQAPPPAIDPNKDPAAVTLGRKGGLKGGRARAESVSCPATRSPEPHMTRFAKHAALVLFTIFGVPLLIATPFLLSGFLGRP